MTFCPECGYEYDPEFSFCPECGSERNQPDSKVSPNAASVPDNSWISICRFDGDMSMKLIQGLLDSSNIPSIIMSAAFESKGNSSVGIDSRLGDSDSDDLIMVPREFHQEAELLLAAMLGDELEIINAPKI